MGKPRIKKIRIILIVIGVILLVGAGFAVYDQVKKLKDKNAKEEADKPALHLTPQADPLALPQITEAVLGETPTMEPPATPSPLPPEVPTPPPPAPLATKTYSHNEMRFSIEVSADWTVQSAPDEMIVKTPAGKRYSIQMYVGAGATRESMRADLAALPNLHNITETQILGQQALAFDMDGIYRHGYAFLYSDRLYYFLGEGIENSPIAKTFKF